MKTKLIIENNYSQLITDNNELKDFLYRKLRFRDRGYYHSSLYRSGRWDGFVNFYSDKTGRFLTGLLTEVSYILSFKEIEYEIEDRREKFEFIFQKIDENFLKYGDLVLYDYQVELVNKIIQMKRGIIRAPTGAGKSAIYVAVARCLPPGCKTIFLFNRKSLAEQLYQDFVKYKLPSVGRLYDKYNDQKDITCCTVQSAKKINNPKEIKCLFVDEVHDMTSNQSISLYKTLENAVVRLGSSATPYKFDEVDFVQKYKVKGWIGSPILLDTVPEKILTNKFLEERGTLSKAKCIFYPIHEPQIPFAIYQDAVAEMAESNYFNDLITNLVKTLSGRILILVDRLSHGEILNTKIKDSFWIHGETDMDERLETIEKLSKERKKVVVIATQQILNTGINCRNNCMINIASGTSNSHGTIQKFGRNLRPADDKEYALYIDFIFHNNPYLHKHSLKRVKVLEKLGNSVEVKEEIDFLI